MVLLYFTPINQHLEVLAEKVEKNDRLFERSEWGFAKRSRDEELAVLLESAK